MVEERKYEVWINYIFSFCYYESYSILSDPEKRKVNCFTFWKRLLLLYNLRKKLQLAIFGGSVLISYLFGIYINMQCKMNTSIIVRKITLAFEITTSILPLIVSKGGDFLLSLVVHKPVVQWIIPVGLSFYSLQLISYLVDIYRGDIPAQKNVFKYMLFVSFFLLSFRDQFPGIAS